MLRRPCSFRVLLRFLSRASFGARGALALGLLGALAFAAPASAQQPNVLFIALDDLNDFPFGGHPETLAPNLDRLAAAGITFANAQTPSPACNPARVAVLTGIAPARSGIYLNSQDQFRTESTALADAVNVFQHFKNHGYRIVAAGKLFHKGRDEPATDWDAYSGISGIGGPPADLLPVNGIAGTDVDGDGFLLPDSFDWGPVERPGEPDATEATWTHNLASWGAGQIAESHPTPTLVAVGFHGPHLPNHAPRKYFDLFPGPVQLPPYLADDLDDVAAPLSNDRFHRDVVAANQWRDGVQGYLASIAFIDDAIGLMLDAWEASEEEWIVVLWSDHGVALGEKDRWGKIFLWEESTRSPLLIAGPGVSPGGVSDLPVSLLDIYPTLIEMAGLTAKPELSGRSLVPAIAAPADPLLDVPVIVDLRGDLAFRSRRWKYIQRKNFRTDELYDHDADPNEWNNLGGDPQYDDVKAWLTSLGACSDPVDADADGYGDTCDNCRDRPNGTLAGTGGAVQIDADGDGIGNACDADFNQDDFVGGPDFDIFLQCFNRAAGSAGGPPDDPNCAESDMNGDGFVGGPDFDELLALFNGPPGPGPQAGCGLGWEVGVALVGLAAARRRRSRRA